jgi:hypothetical protein
MSLSQQEILARLAQLPPDSNPFLFLNELVESSARQPWQTGYTVLIGICAAVWAVDLGLNLYVLRHKLGKGERTFVRRQATSMGTLYIPQIALVWPVISIPLALSIIMSATLLIYQGYEPRLKAAQVFIFMALTIATVLSSCHIMSQTASALVTYSANRSAQTPRHRYLNVANLFNVTGVLYLVVQTSCQITFYIAQTVYLARALDGVEAASIQLLRLAAAWEPGARLATWPAPLPPAGVPRYHASNRSMQ